MYLGAPVSRYGQSSLWTWKTQETNDINDVIFSSLRDGHLLAQELPEGSVQLSRSATDCGATERVNTFILRWQEAHSTTKCGTADSTQQSCLLSIQPFEKICIDFLLYSRLSPVAVATTTKCRAECCHQVCRSVCHRTWVRPRVHLYKLTQSAWRSYKKEIWES